MPPPLPFPVAEANRTDLNVPTPSPQPQGQPNGKPQAMQLPTGTGYGERQSLQAAQKAVPLPKAPAGPQPHMGLTHGEALAQAKQFPVLPGQLGAFTRPTERPNEPVTAGLPGNVPGGPMPQQVPSSNLATMLSRIAQAANSPALGELAQRAARLGQ